MEHNSCHFCGMPVHAKVHGYCSVVCQVMAGCSGTYDPKGCWIWQRAKRENGYGIMRVLIDGKYRMRSPARVIYAAEYGEVMYTRSVLNTCGTKNCCNPRHLRVGVQELSLRFDEGVRKPAEQPAQAPFEKVA